MNSENQPTNYVYSWDFLFSCHFVDTRCTRFYMFYVNHCKNQTDFQLIAMYSIFHIFQGIFSGNLAFSHLIKTESSSPPPMESPLSGKLQFTRKMGVAVKSHAPPCQALLLRIQFQRCQISYCKKFFVAQYQFLELFGNIAKFTQFASLHK